MSRVVYAQKYWTREEVAADLGHVYLFGDNLMGKGCAGQACIRGLPNAIGIPTKRFPSCFASSFFSDNEYAGNVAHIDRAFDKIPPDVKIVVSKDGLGTGLAQLPQRAPKTYAYLLGRLRAL